jgi:hypothetical protein
MEDKEIFKLVDDRERKINKSFNDSIDRFTRSISDLITQGNEDIKDKLKGICETIDKHDNCIDKLEQWKSGVVAGKIAFNNFEKKSHDKTIRIATIAMAIVAGLAFIFSIANGRVNKKLKTEQYILEWKIDKKADRMPDSAARSFVPIITNRDTL